MTDYHASPLFAAIHVQSMAEKTEGKMAFVLTSLSCQPYGYCPLVFPRAD